MCPTPVSILNILPSFGESLNRLEGSKSLVRSIQFSGTLSLKSSEFTEQWAWLMAITLSKISSLSGAIQGSKVTNFLILLSLEPMTIAVVAPNPWPMQVKLSMSMLTGFWSLPRVLFVKAYNSLINWSISFSLIPSLVLIWLISLISTCLK